LIEGATTTTATTTTQRGGGRIFNETIALMIATQTQQQLLLLQQCSSHFNGSCQRFCKCRYPSDSIATLEVEVLLSQTVSTKKQNARSILIFVLASCIQAAHDK
jgi:hypothetical protein